MSLDHSVGTIYSRSSTQQACCYVFMSYLYLPTSDVDILMEQHTNVPKPLPDTNQISHLLQQHVDTKYAYMPFSIIYLWISAGQLYCIMCMQACSAVTAVPLHHCALSLILHELQQNSQTYRSDVSDHSKHKKD